MKIRITLFFALICLLQSFCFSQNETLSNKSILDMVKAGLDPDLVVGKIKSSSCKFDLSTTALITLKNNKVPSTVIKAMMEKGETGSAVPGSNNETTDKKINAPEKPLSALEKLDVGIYWENVTGSYQTIESSVFTQTKSGSGFLTGLTYGAAKTKYKAVLKGISSNLQIKTAEPVFYFVFPKNSNPSGGLSVHAWDGNISSPKEFVLVKFKVINTNKTQGREMVTGSFSGGGMQGGIADENIVAFKYEKVAGNIYKIFFEKPVEDGEYAFMYAGGNATYGAAAVNKAYDFSIVK